MAAPAAEPQGPPPSGAAGGLAGEWFTAYTNYLKRAGDHSAKTLELYQEITDRIVRGDLAPTATQDMLASFLQTRGSAYSDQLAQLNMQFFSEMVRISTAYAHELGHAVLPEAPAAPAPPTFDAADPAGWFQQLTDYSQQLSTNIAATYQALLVRAAAGGAVPSQIQEAAAAYLERRLPELLSELGQLYFDLLNGLTELRMSSEQEFLGGVLERVNGASAGQAFELTLEAPLGGSATASLSIANTRVESAHVRCDTTEVRRADGVGPAFAPKLTVAPEHVELAPGEEAVLVVTLELDEGDFSPDVLYVGKLQISGQGEPRLEVPLRIMATEPVATTT